MTAHKSQFIENLDDGKENHGDVAGGNVRLYRGIVDLSEITIASGDTVEMVKVPAKGKVVSRKLGASVTLGTSTISVGDGTTAAKYRASAVKTDAKPEELLSPASDAAGEKYVLTVGTAALPTSGLVWIDVLVADV